MLWVCVMDVDVSDRPLTVINRLPTILKGHNEVGKGSRELPLEKGLVSSFGMECYTDSMGLISFLKKLLRRPPSSQYVVSGYDDEDDEDLENDE